MPLQSDISKALKTLSMGLQRGLGFLLLTFSISLCLGLQCNPTKANELNFLLNGASIHMEEAKVGKYNEQNSGIGFQFDLGDSDEKWVKFLSVSVFKDSNDESSYYFGGGILRRYILAEQFDNLHVDVGGIGFFMTRKDYLDGDLFPGVLPALSFGTDSVAINVTYIPKVSPKMVALWFFQLKISIDGLF
jgi:hypothetical protein